MEPRSIDQYVADQVYSEDEPTRQRGLQMYRHMAAASALMSVLDALDTQPPELLRGYVIARIQALETASSAMARDLAWPMDVHRWFRDLSGPYLRNHMRRQVARMDPFSTCDSEDCYELAIGAIFDGTERVGAYCTTHLEQWRG